MIEGENMNGIDVVKQAIAMLPIEVATGTVSRNGETMTVAEFLENNLAPFMNDKTPQDVIIFVNTRLKKYITEGKKIETTPVDNAFEAAQTIIVKKPVITREEVVVRVNKPTINFAEPQEIVEETNPFVITTKIPTINFEKTNELAEKVTKIKEFIESDPKYSELHYISPVEQNSFKQFMDLYPMELVELSDDKIYIKFGERTVSLEEAYNKFIAPINVYEEELLEDKFKVIVGEIYDIMEYHEIDDRNKEILFKSKTENGKVFFDYIKEDILPTITNAYNGPHGEELHNYLDKVLGMQIAFDNDKLNTNNNVSPEGDTLDEVNKVGEIKIIDGSITSEMLTLLTNSEKNSLNSNLQLADDERIYITRFEQLEIGIKKITDHDDLEERYKEFTNLVAEAQLKCPESNYIKTLISRINIIYENKNKSLKTINESKDTFKMMFETALAELKYNVSLVSTFNELVEARIAIKHLEEKMTSLGFTNNVYQAAIDNIKNILEARSLQVQQIKRVEEVQKLAA